MSVQLAALRIARPPSRKVPVQSGKRIVTRTMSDQAVGAAIMRLALR